MKKIILIVIIVVLNFFILYKYYNYYNTKLKIYESQLRFYKKPMIERFIETELGYLSSVNYYKIFMGRYGVSGIINNDYSKRIVLDICCNNEYCFIKDKNIIKNININNNKNSK